MHAWIERERLLEEYLAVLVDHSVRVRGVPRTLATSARDATVRNLRPSSEERAGETRARAGAYFEATVRRISARSSSPEVVAYRRRVIARLIEEDLRGCGVSEERIAREVEEWDSRCVSA